MSLDKMFLGLPALSDPITATDGLIVYRSGFFRSTVTQLPVSALVQTALDAKVTIGAMTGTGITMATARLLGRSTASTGAVEEISLGSGLSLSGGVLTAAGSGGTVTVSGTPTSGQIAEWTTATNIQGVASNGTGNVVRTTSASLTTPALGTPSAGVLTSCTGLPIASGVSGLGTGVATFLATPTSANLASAVATTSTGSGALVFGTSPSFTTAFTLANSAGPTTGAVAVTAFNTTAWAASRGAIQIHDGTANTYVVAALASDTPTNGQVPTWNTGGTVTWETPSGGGTPAGSDRQIQFNNSGAFGASANLTFATSTGPLQLQCASTANTTQDGFTLVNPGTASSGNQMYGPRLKTRGSGWHTGGTASSQVVDWSLENRPVQGAGTNNPSALLAIQVNVHTSGDSDALTIFSGVNTVATLAPTIVTVNTSRSDSSPRIDYASGGTTTVYTGAAASGQTITAGASAGDFVIMPAATGKKLALSFDVGTTVGTSISSTGVTTTGGFQCASGSGVTFGASGGSIIGTSGDVTIASSGSTKDININPTTLGYVVFNNGSNARGLKINNTGGSNPIEFQMSGTTKGVIAIPNATNNWITGSAQYDMTFVNAASQSFLFSTDNGTSAHLKLTASNAGAVFASSITTAAPVGGAGVSAWKHGQVRTGIGLVILGTAGIQIDVDGTLYTLAVLSTNP